MLARSSLSMFCVILVQLLGLEAEQLREFTDVSEGSDLNKDPRHFIPEKRNKESLKERMQRRIQYGRRSCGRYMLLRCCNGVSSPPPRHSLDLVSVAPSQFLGRANWLICGTQKMTEAEITWPFEVNVYRRKAAFSAVDITPPSLCFKISPLRRPFFEKLRLRCP